MLSIKNLSIGFVIAVALHCFFGLAAEAETFSQLSFDGPAFANAEQKEAKSVENDLSLEQLREILDSQGSATQANRKITVAARAQSRAQLESATAPAKFTSNKNLAKISQNWERNIPGDEASIIPSLKGVKADAGSESKLLTELTWKAGRNGQCAEPANSSELCSKTLALKELLHRYTGNDDFFDIQCPFTCRSSQQTAALAGLRISDAKGGSFQMDNDGGTCRYEITKDEKANWALLTAAKATCVCLPNSCN